MDLRERKGSGQRHPWELARARFFLSLLAERDLLATGADWLDIGSGDAWFAEQLRRRLPESATVTCWDPAYTEAELEQPDAGVTLVAERPEGRFDRLLLLDVIEHVEDDRGFLAGAVGDLLADGGYLLLSVPAHQALFSAHDRMLLHYRRYAPADCRRLLQGSGLDLVVDGGLFLSLLPVRAAQVAVERARKREAQQSGVGAWQKGGGLTGVLTRALDADAALSLRLSRRGVTLPGLSYWALCRRSTA